jgi:nitric oxide reductase subunit B
LSNAKKNHHSLSYRLLFFADLWIFLNLGAAIAISIPALNYYTHGTHITVAHAMGTTIGINTMLLFASVFYILQQQKPSALDRKKKFICKGIALTNIALIFFCASLMGSGMVKVSGKLHNQAFAQIMEACSPFFKLFTASGIFILMGLAVMMVGAFKVIRTKEERIPPLIKDKSTLLELDTAW